MRGGFRIYPGQENEQFIRNTLLDEGEISFLKMIAWDDQAVIAGGGNFYIGLCGSTFDETTTLSTLTGEPGATGGYARQAVLRTSGGWPNTAQINGVWRIATAVVNFTASGADFDTTFRRVFLCSVVNGSMGKLFAVSGELPTAQAIIDGQTFPVQYELYLN